MRIVLYKYYNFLYYILIFFKFFGLRFNYLNISNFSILGSNLSLDNLADRLKKRGITPLPIEDIEKIIDIQPFMHDLKKEVFATNCKVINDNLIDKSLKFFGNKSNTKNKLRVTLQKSFGELFFHIKSKIDIWSNSTNEKIVYIVPFYGIFFSFDREKVIKIVLPLESIELCKIFIFKISNLIKKKIFLIIRFKNKSNRKHENKRSMSEFKKCLFLHFGRTYGNLFHKKIYFSDDIKSEYHQKNFLYIDYTNSLKDEMDNEYNIQNLTSIDLLMIKKILFFFLSSLIYCRNFRTFIGIFKFSFIYFDYLKYGKILSKFKNINECFFDNDITSPKELFLALDEKNIISVCHQDRFLISFCNTYPTNISNTYYSISSFIKKILLNSKNYAPDNIIPAGFWKTGENLHKSKRYLSQIKKSFNFKKKITVLGQNIPDKWYESKTNPYNSWKAQIKFFNDVFDLSKTFPDYLFVLRFKDLEWLQNDNFKKIVFEIEKTDNIYLSRDYDVEHYSFLLCKDSDLVVGQYTSLIDECISNKIPSLIIDYNHQVNKIFSKAFDYEKPSIFCQDSKDLETKIKNFFNGEEIYVDVDKFFNFR